MRLSSRKYLLLLIAIALLLSAFLMARVQLPAWAPIASAVSMVLFAVPCVWALRRWLGWRDGFIVYLILAFFALVVEAIAVSTGFPYGRFSYSEHLGYKLFDTVPWTVAFGWPPLVLGCYAIAANLTTRRALRVFVGVAMLVACDLVLDPGAVRMNFWTFVGGGAYYSVPISNFAGWLLSGTVGMVLLDVIVRRLKPLLSVPVQLTGSAILTLFFWTALAAFAGLAVPAAVGFALVGSFILCWRKFYYAFDDKIVLVDERGHSIATASKLVAHNKNTHLHRAFSVFVFNRRGELLLQQRALSKKTWPGVWSNSCCGHVMLHESVEDAARRRLKYELGLAVKDLEVVLPDFRYRAEKDGIVENEICPVLIAMANGDPAIDPTEVEAIAWEPWPDFVSSLQNSEREISPWALDEARLLAADGKFLRWFESRTGHSERPIAL